MSKRMHHSLMSSVDSGRFFAGGMPDNNRVDEGNLAAVRLCNFLSAARQPVLCQLGLRYLRQEWGSHRRRSRDVAVYSGKYSDSGMSGQRYPLSNARQHPRTSAASSVSCRSSWLRCTGPISANSCTLLLSSQTRMCCTGMQEPPARPPASAQQVAALHVPHYNLLRTTT